VRNTGYAQERIFYWEGGSSTGKEALLLGRRLFYWELVEGL